MQDYVSKFAALLAQANDDPESEAGQEVQVRQMETALHIWSNYRCSHVLELDYIISVCI